MENPDDEVERFDINVMNPVCCPTDTTRTRRIKRKSLQCPARSSGQRNRYLYIYIYMMVPMYVSLLYDEGGNGGFRMVAPSRAEEKKRKSKKRRWTQWMDGAVVVVRVKEEQRSTNQFFFSSSYSKEGKGEIAG